MAFRRKLWAYSSDRDWELFFNPYSGKYIVKYPDFISLAFIE